MYFSKIELSFSINIIPHSVTLALVPAHKQRTTYHNGILASHFSDCSSENWLLHCFSKLPQQRTFVSMTLLQHGYNIPSPYITSRFALITIRFLFCMPATRF